MIEYSGYVDDVCTSCEGLCCPPFAVVYEGEHENPPTSEVQPVIRLSDTKNVCLLEIHRHVVEVYGKGAMTREFVETAPVCQRRQNSCAL